MRRNRRHWKWFSRVRDRSLFAWKAGSSFSRSWLVLRLCLGLLGAVAGLVRVFGNIGSGAMSTSDLKGIASGIGEALSHDHRRIVDRYPGSCCLHLFFTTGRETGGRDGVTADRLDRKDLSVEPRTGIIRAGRGIARGSSAMRFYAKRKRTPQVIIVSLIDIFAILLIFFIVTTTFKTAESELSIKTSGIQDRDPSREPD